MEYVRTERKPYLGGGAGLPALRALLGVGRELLAERGWTASRSSRRGWRRPACSTASRWTTVRERYSEEFARHRPRGAGRAAARRVDHLDHVFHGEPGAIRSPDPLQQGHSTMANMAQAVRMALHFAEEHLGVTDIFGEDVGAPLGGVVHLHAGAQDHLELAARRARHHRHGHGHRAWPGHARSPRSSSATTSTTPSICSSSRAARTGRRTGEWNLPMVVMTPVGSGIRGSIYHSHSVRRDGDPPPGLEDRDAVHAARRVRAHAVGVQGERTR